MANQHGLSPEQVSSFHRDGYLIIRNALLPDTVSGLLTETNTLLQGMDLTNHPLTRFSTGKTSEHVGDDYFLTSGDKIRFFFEEEAFDAAGTLVKPKEKAVNKIGHYLHELSPPFKALLDGEAAKARGEVSPVAVARAIGYEDPRVLQSMVICKQPEIGGEVPPHQDSTFLYTNPPSALGLWYALEDATLENGCLSFLPGSHKTSPVTTRLVRKAFHAGTEMVDNDGPAFPPGDEYGVDAAEKSAENQGYVPGEVKAGDLVLIHGNLLHKSEKK